ncbi:hypothetical protein CONCODRAFT_3867 [Conidiobolus coronatus NRRL 28638]|uniref:Uncharacterized protein n=1 Tax=Conidiobolus coronatus (strain ATCC 28846 / CBS 209.66 / NRRL 28638) TaxID=796925 RepID=A0A137PDX2_CONC2|nr:hypothetical protein CONCODRAFT_3867 [Conidiobolus coronatus NRRL 28638]|eukprot:KXN73199.1 hypothetical protein CONCODRAFT_3867 [Conidiobolus coronatus NRRL 28638]
MTHPEEYISSKCSYPWEIIKRINPVGKKYNAPSEDAIDSELLFIKRCLGKQVFEELSDDVNDILVRYANEEDASKRNTQKMKEAGIMKKCVANPSATQQLLRSLPDFPGNQQLSLFGNMFKIFFQRRAQPLKRLTHTNPLTLTFSFTQTRSQLQHRKCHLSVNYLIESRKYTISNSSMTSGSHTNHETRDTLFS